MKSDAVLMNIIQFLGLAFFGGFAIWIALNIFYYYTGDSVVMDVNSNCPIALIGRGGERIYLPFGTIYALKDDPDKEYDIVTITVHVTSEAFAKLICFDSTEEAEALGFVLYKYEATKNYFKNSYSAPKAQYRVASN